MVALVDKILELDRSRIVVDVEEVTPTCVKLRLNNGYGVSVLQKSRVEVRDGVAEVGILAGPGGLTSSHTIASLAFGMPMGSDAVRESLEAGEIFAILDRIRLWPQEETPGAPISGENVRELIGTDGDNVLVWRGGGWEVWDSTRFPFGQVSKNEASDVMYGLELGDGDAWDESGWSVTEKSGGEIAEVLNSRLNLA